MDPQQKLAERERTALLLQHDAREKQNRQLQRSSKNTVGFIRNVLTNWISTRISDNKLSIRNNLQTIINYIYKNTLQ